MSGQRSPLCSVPPEILDKVAFELVSDILQGPPSVLLPLLQTCKHINRSLSTTGCIDLYSRIFKAKFDHLSAIRRIARPISSEYVEQLMDCCKLLQVIRSGDIYSADIDHVLFMALIMMMENDGKNRVQLEWAGLDEFVHRFVRERLHETRERYNGWPEESAQNACALWLMWMMTTEAKLLAETERERQEIVNLVLPYVLAPYRYASAQALPQLPLDNSDFVPPLTPPLITIAAKLIYFSRRFTPFRIPSHLPLTRTHALQLGIYDIAPTQADMIEFNAHSDRRLVKMTKWDWWEGLTKEDWDREMNGVSKAPSVAWDNDWLRMSVCHSAWGAGERMERVYNPGSMTGLWQGRMLNTGIDELSRLITIPDCPANFSEGYLQVTATPIFMRLQEHYCIAPNEPISWGGQGDNFDDGLLNAYFPDGMQYQQTTNIDGSGTVTVSAEGQSAEYETRIARRPNLHDSNGCPKCIALTEELERMRAKEDEEAYGHLSDVVGLGTQAGESVDGTELGLDMPLLQEHDESNILSGDIQDIIFTGKTDEHHGLAWHHFDYYGRVRAWDGLIILLRVPRDRRNSKMIFYGYIVGNENFVGSWRNVRTGMTDFGGPFMMSRRDD